MCLEAIFLWCASVLGMGICYTSWQWSLAGVHFCWKHLKFGMEQRITSQEVSSGLHLFTYFPFLQTKPCEPSKGYLIFPEGLPISCCLSCWRNLQCLQKYAPHSSQMHNLGYIYTLVPFLGNWNIKKDVSRIMHIIFSLFYFSLNSGI